MRLLRNIPTWERALRVLLGVALLAAAAFVPFAEGQLRPGRTREEIAEAAFVAALPPRSARAVRWRTPCSPCGSTRSRRPDCGRPPVALQRSCVKLLPGRGVSGRK
jgi:hypothetical protein